MFIGGIYGKVVVMDFHASANRAKCLGDDMLS